MKARGMGRKLPRRCQHVEAYPAGVGMTAFRKSCRRLYSMVDVEQIRHGPRRHGKCILCFLVFIGDIVGA